MLYHCYASFKQSLLDFFKLLDSRLILIGVDLTGIWGTYGGTYYKSPAVEAKKHIFLHSRASNLVIKILQHDKIWGDNPPRSKFGGDLSPAPSPWSTPMLILMLLYDSVNLIISGVHQWHLGCWVIRLKKWNWEVWTMLHTRWHCVSALFYWKTKLLSAMCLVAINILLRW